MDTCQLEFRRVVVETRRLPGSRRMTRLATLAEVAGNVIRIRGSCEVRSMTLITIGKSEIIIVVHMARLTLN